MVVVVGVADVLVVTLELDEHQRDPVYESDEVASALVERALNPELLGCDEVVPLGVLEVEHLRVERFRGSVFPCHLDGDTVA